MEDRRSRIRYEQLRALSVGQPFLDIHVHRYFAGAKNIGIGCFSNLEMACLEVDNRRQFKQPSSWVERPNGNWPRPESYVMDLATGKLYERVAQSSMAESEPTLA